MSPQVLSRYETALASKHAHKALTDTVRKQLEIADQPAVLAELEELRERLQARNDADAEDVVLDVMDTVTGFCSPGARVT